MTKYSALVALGMAFSLFETSSAGSIERALGGDRLAHRNLESLATSDLNSRALDSLVRGVEQLAKTPDLSSLPSVQVGRRTVSLDGLSPLVDMAKRLKEQAPSLSGSSATSFGDISLPSGFVSPSTSPNLTSPFSSLETAIEASPLPSSARADLTRMVRSIKEFTGAK